ncbi:MAG: response regulator transcription factor [Tepidiformaceae bacterium]
MNVIQRDVWRTRIPRGRLTPREHEVLELIALGLTNAQVGARLAVAPPTAKGHIEHVLWKTRSANRAAAAIFYAQRHPPSSVRPPCALLA